MGRTATHSESLFKGGEPRVNDLIMTTEYDRRHSVVVYEVPSLVIGEHIPAYFNQYGLILSATSDNLNGGQNFHIILDRLALVSITNSLDSCVRKMPVIRPVENQLVGSVVRLVISPLSVRSWVACGWKSRRFPTAGDPTPHSGRYR